MAKKKDGKPLEKKIQFKISTSINIETKKISYCITRISRLDKWVPDYCGVGANMDSFSRIIEENELPPHERDKYDGYLFDTYDDAHIAMEKIAERMRETYDNEIEIVSRNT